MSAAWDPEQYLRFADERSRPFEDLLARVGRTGGIGSRGGADQPVPALVVDLGCGPGNLTASLSDRWPSARVVGVDSSPEMVERASSLARPGRLEFVAGDLRCFEPDGPVDVLVSAATLQWVPGHVELFGRFLSWLAPGGCFAFHVPGNFDQPSHVLLHELATSDRWRDRLAAAVESEPSSLGPAVYLRALLDAGASAVDVWETTYFHLLQGHDAVLEWIKGTGLRPVLGALGEGPDRAEFLASYGAALRAAYPRDEEDRTVFPFRRIFAVAWRGA
ncbi:MAG TPA: methyltransferase domain-containing protein [Acidimicrobiales bacterium]|nr:methyltransferase domain-containing protein [Acidimicrobiales bacterium]